IGNEDVSDLESADDSSAQSCRDQSLRLQFGHGGSGRQFGLLGADAADHSGHISISIAGKLALLIGKNAALPSFYEWRDFPIESSDDCDSTHARTGEIWRAAVA